MALKDELNAKSVVMTNGCFDILHLGHVRYLKQAKGLGDILLVAVNSDRSVRGIKGSKRPVQPDYARAEIIASLEFVDYVVLFDEPTAEEITCQLQPDIYVKGGDYCKTVIPEGTIVKSYGGEVVTVSTSVSCSTTDIIRKIIKTLQEPSGVD